jgi:hypothetical protein
MTRFIRLLIQKSLWMYGFTALLPFIGFFLLMIFAQSPSQNADIFYPFLTYRAEILLTILVWIALQFVIIIALYTQKSTNVSKVIGLSVGAIMIVGFGLVFMGPAVWDVLEDEGGVAFDSTIYHLAGDSSSTPYPYLDHILYECDYLGLWCSVVARDIRSREGKLTVNVTTSDLQLIEESGGIAYSYRPSY